VVALKGFIGLPLEDVVNPVTGVYGAQPVLLQIYDGHVHFVAVPPEAVVKLMAVRMRLNGRLQHECCDLLVVDAVAFIPAHVVEHDVVSLAAAEMYQVLLAVVPEALPGTFNPLHPGEWLFFALHVAK
jgi:hypothetical protein